MDKEKDIISRRQFFKRSASAILPAVAMVVLPSALTSCEYDPVEYGMGGTGCNNSCSKNCSGGCSGSSSKPITTSCRATTCTSGCGKGCSRNCSVVCVTKSK